MAGRTSYTPEERAFIEECYASMTNAELAAALNARFGTRATAAVMNRYGSNHGLRKTPEARSRGIAAGNRSIWTPEVDAWFAAYVPGHSTAEVSAECERMFGVRLTDAQVSNRKARLGVRSGTHGGRFEKGHVPANKGRPWSEWMTSEGAEGSRRGQFKPGCLQGYAAQHRHPVGYERVNRDGYTEVKVKDGVQSAPNDNFKFKHRLVWERANGRELKPGEMVVFCDGDKRNFDPANLAIETRAEHAIITRRGYRYCDRATHDVAVAAARLALKTGEVERHERPCRRCGRTFKPRFKRQRTCDACLGRES